MPALRWLDIQRSGSTSQILRVGIRPTWPGIPIIFILTEQTPVFWADSIHFVSKSDGETNGQLDRNGHCDRAASGEIGPSPVRGVARRNCHRKYRGSRATGRSTSLHGG